VAFIGLSSDFKGSKETLQILGKEEIMSKIGIFALKYFITENCFGDQKILIHKLIEFCKQWK
jgi:hypothetical protein